MKISWGWKIGLLYLGFVGLIVTLVVASSRQHIDLVSPSYYADEVAYQGVIDAGKNQSGLSSAINVHADAQNVVITIPTELATAGAKGVVRFYSPVDAKFDRKFDLQSSGNSMSIDRSKLKNTRYTIKIDIEANGKKYYQETELNLHS